MSHEPVDMAPSADDLFGDASMFDSLMEGDDVLDPMFSSYNGSLTLAPELCPVGGGVDEHDPMLAALLALDDTLAGGDINMV